MEPQNSKKGSWLVILLILVIVVAGAYYWMTMSQTPEVVSNEVQTGLELADFGDLDAELQALDIDLDQL